MRHIRVIAVLAFIIFTYPACQSADKSEGLSSSVSSEQGSDERQSERTEPSAQADPTQQSGQAEEPPKRSAESEATSSQSEAEQTIEAVGGQLGDGVSAALIPEEEDPTRRRRRMDIDQLNQTILRVTGGIGWVQSNKNQFEVLSTTLGKPDYIDLTKEDFEPSALFQKFLDDAARAVCAELVAKELSVPSTKRVFMVHSSPYKTWDDDPDAIDKNLAYLILRYHGRDLTEKSAELQQWRWLYRSAEHVSKKPVTAWRTVCIGLMTHPYFYTY